MVDQERRGATIGFVANKDIPPPAVINVCGFNVSLPGVLPTSVFVIALATVLLIVLSNSAIFPAPQQNSCFAILVFATIMWAFEAIPLFVTSVIIPGLIVGMRVMTDGKGNRLDSKAGAKKIFGEMFGPVIMLLLGGFVLAGALSKHNIAKSLASVILSRAGSKPANVLLANVWDLSHNFRCLFLHLPQCGSVTLLLPFYAFL